MPFPAMADTAPPPAPGTRAWLWARLRRERVRADDLLQRAKWVQAELENVRKQAERDRAQAADRAVADLVQRLLPALDALDAAPPSEGLDLVRRDVAAALAAQGVVPLAAAGQPYDPLRHEAVLREARPCRAGEAPGLVVAEELRKGWALRGKVLRPAIVRVLELTPPAPPAAHPPQERDA